MGVAVVLVLGLLAAVVAAIMLWGAFSALFHAARLVWRYLTKPLS